MRSRRKESGQLQATGKQSQARRVRVEASRNRKQANRKTVSGSKTSSNGSGGNAGKGPGDWAFALLDGQDLIGFQVRNFGQLTAGPLDFDFFDGAMLAEPEMQPRILGGLIAHATFSLIVKNQIAGSDFHASADGVAIRTRADEEKLQPVIGVASVVAQQLRCLPIVADEDIEVSIVVKVGD